MGSLFVSAPVPFSSILLLACLVSLTLSADSDKFIRIGKGTLLSVEGNGQYKTILYGNIGSTKEKVKAIMVAAAREHDDICVGFMTDTDVIGQGILLYDESKIDSSSWPPGRPSALNSAAQLLLTSYWPNQHGRSVLSLTSSKNSNQEFSRWKSFAKAHLLAISYIGEGTLLSNSQNLVFSMMPFTNIASSVDRLHHIMMRAAIQADGSCVGFHIMESPSDEKYLNGVLLYDIDKAPEWPMPTPGALKHATVTGTPAGSGKGDISYTTSANSLSTFSAWSAYAKLEMMYEPMTYIGEGTLIDERGKYYGIVVFSGIANSERELWVIIRRAYLECGDACVGFQYNPVNDASYLQAALLYDRQKQPTWPPVTPPSLSSDENPSYSRDEESHQGYGAPATSSWGVRSSWTGWRCYASSS